MSSESAAALGLLTRSSWNSDASYWESEFKKRGLPSTTGNGVFVVGFRPEHVDGIHENDIIVRMGKHALNDKTSYDRAFNSLRVGVEENIVVKRVENGKWKLVKITVTPLDRAHLNKLDTAAAAPPAANAPLDPLAQRLADMDKLMAQREQRRAETSRIQDLARFPKDFVGKRFEFSAYIKVDAKNMESLPEENVGPDVWGLSVWEVKDRLDGFPLFDKPSIVSRGKVCCVMSEAWARRLAGEYRRKFGGEDSYWGVRIQVEVKEAQYGSLSPIPFYAAVITNVRSDNEDAKWLAD
jgi:hypothetical protein